MTDPNDAIALTLAQVQDAFAPTLRRLRPMPDAPDLLRPGRKPAPLDAHLRRVARRVNPAAAHDAWENGENLAARLELPSYLLVELEWDFMFHSFARYTVLPLDGGPRLYIQEMDTSWEADCPCFLLLAASPAGADAARADDAFLTLLFRSNGGAFGQMVMGSLPTSIDGPDRDEMERLLLEAVQADDDLERSLRNEDWRKREPEDDDLHDYEYEWRGYASRLPADIRQLVMESSYIPRLAWWKAPSPNLAATLEALERCAGEEETRNPHTDREAFAESWLRDRGLDPAALAYTADEDEYDSKMYPIKYYLDNIDYSE